MDSFRLIAASLAFIGIFGGGSGDIACGQTSLQRITSALSDGVFLTHAPGDTERVFFVEQGSGGTGRIRVMNLSSSTPTTFMTVSGLVTGSETGLLGLAFDPDYLNNGYFYTYSSRPSGGSNHQSQVTRYQVTGDPATSNSASTTTAFELMSFAQPFSNHNGGWIGFNPAETKPYLYIASGDGGDANDPQNNAQDITNNLLGKMLRIDVRGDDFPTSSTQNYAIPPDNPFVDATGDDEIWSYGLRNPWRNSFDPRTGDLWIADVGQNAREEINHEPKGASGRNYGWKVEEGLRCNNNSQIDGNPPCGDPELVEPVHDYIHDFFTGGFSVTGGYVYRGSVAQYEGLYFFADHITEKIWTLDPYADDISNSVIERNGELPTNLGGLDGISSFGEDGNGELYLLSYRNGNAYRFESTSQEATWNGDDNVGTVGDGVSWSSQQNWTRGSSIDVAAVSKDKVVFAAGSSVPTIDLQGARSVAGMEFQADYRLTNGSLDVLSGNIEVHSGVTANVDVTVLAESESASLRKRGLGRLNINGTGASVMVFEGTLGGTGIVNRLRVFEGARVSPGEADVIGTLTAFAYDPQPNTVLEINVDGASHDADRLMVNGPATLDGMLEIAGTDYLEADRASVDEFVILVAAPINDTFDGATYNGVSIDGNPAHVGDGLFVSLEYAEFTLTLVNYLALPGDANGDRVVDGTDFQIWNLNKFNQGTDWTTADFNGDGVTDGFDLLVWNENKFRSVSANVPVPEPHSFACCLLLAGLMIRRPFGRTS